MSETGNEKTTQENNITEMFAALRKFEIELDSGEKKMAEIRIPSMDEQRRAEEYAATIIAEKANGEPDPITGKVIKLPTVDNMIEYAKEKGMWTNEDDVEFQSLETQLRTNIDQLARGKMKLSRGYELAMQIMQNRKRIQPYNSRRWEIYGLTANAAGEEAQHEYLCVATAVWEKTGERIFADIAAFKKASAQVRNQVLAQYLMLVRMANEYTTALPTEIGFFRDYGFLDNDWNIYDINKKNIVMNIAKDSAETSQEEIYADMTDDDGNIIEKSMHPSMPKQVDK